MGNDGKSQCMLLLHIFINYKYSHRNIFAIDIVMQSTSTFIPMKREYTNFIKSIFHKHILLQWLLLQNSYHCFGVFTFTLWLFICT